MFPESRALLDRINLAFNEEIYSGEGAASYDRTHRYGEPEQHEYPSELLVSEIWATSGYGRALEVGAGTGYFTALIARRAETLLALAPVPDMRRVLQERCRREGLTHVQVSELTAFDLAKVAAADSIDTAFMLHSLHHFHRRPEIFAAVGRALRPGGRLLLLEPHHNVRRVTRLLKNYLTTYRAPAFWQREQNWATTIS